MALTLGTLVPYDPTGQDKGIQVKTLVQKLNDELRMEGIELWIDKGVRLENDFVRVNISKGGGIRLGESNLFLDLRMGLWSPRGQVIEMASSTTSNYGMPGFARHIPGENRISNTAETFKDYIRSIYDFAQAEGKQPREVAWTVYQKGYEPRNYPGSEDVFDEGHEVPMTPKVGGVITRSSSSGMRALMASTVRWVLPWGKEVEEYIQDTMKLGNKGVPSMLPGYGPNLKMSGWIPMGTAQYQYRPPFEGGAQTFVDLPRGLDSFKSMTSTFGARNLADVPLVRDESGRLVRVQPTEATQGKGFRTGWTKSTIVLPTETEPRTVFSASVAMIDQPDMPGAMLQSKGAFDFFAQKMAGKGVVPRLRTAAIGESGDITMQFGVKTTAQLRQLVEQGLEFLDIEGTQMQPGTSKHAIARYYPEGQENPYRNMFIDERGYPVVLHKPTLHIPKYYDITPQGELFSNIPVVNEEGSALNVTDAIIADLKQKYGDQIAIAQYSSIGSRGEKNPAAVYLTIPMERINPVGMKSDAFKAYPAAKDYEFKLQYADTGGRVVPVDFVTQEGKIPARAIMQAVGIMNKQSALEFMGTFLPQETPEQKMAVDLIKDYITKRFNQSTVRLETTDMATIWYRATKERVSPDQLFSMVGDRIGALADGMNAVDLYQNFGLRIPTRQMAFGGLYSDTAKAQLEQVFAEFGPEASSLLQFKKYIKPGTDTAMGEALREAVQQQMWEMYYQVPGGASKNITLQTGLSFVSEYVSQSGFINAKGLMSLADNYPRISRALGLTDKAGNWKGVFSSKAYKGGRPQPSVVSNQELLPYIEFQNKLFNTSEIDTALPAKHISIGPDLAGDLLYAIGKAKGQPTDEAQLGSLYESLKEFSLKTKTYGLDSRTSFLDEFWYDANSGTIAPSIQAVMGVEKFREPGVLEGETLKFVAKNYMNLLEAMARSAGASPGAELNKLAPVREAFFNKINKMVYPGGRRSKEFFRSITGMTLPGTRGGRYQGMTELESGYAYASDEYIIRLLSNGKFAKAGQIDSIMRWINSDPKAYLPVLFQRFPDVGGATQFLPLKLRSAKAWRSVGLPIPEGPTATDMIFISTDVNRFQAGDFDADPAKAKVIPMYRLFDPDQKKYVDSWYMGNEVQGEFEQKFQEFFGNMAAVGSNLEQLFGQYGNAPGWQVQTSLDVARKNAADYITTILGHASKTAATSYETRRKQPFKAVSAAEAQQEQMNVIHMKGGMGLSYILRSELTDIASAVLGMGGRDTGIFKSAYEGAGLTYQMYLDRWQKMRGGFTALETLMNTYGIYQLQEKTDLTTNRKYTDYNVTYKFTEQGKETNLPKKSWGTAGFAGQRASNQMLRGILNVVGEMPRDIMTDEMLAWLTAGEGGSEKILHALQNPEDFWGQQGVEGVISKNAIANRANILTKMVETGEVGFRSPLYMGLTYKAIKRAFRDFPAYAGNPDVTLPWLNGEYMSISDISKTPEFRLWGVAENMFIRGSGPIDPADRELLRELGGIRLSGEMAGIYQAWRKVTHGIYPVEKAEKEYGERHRESFKLYQASVMKRTPVIHASELGALLPMPEGLGREGWLFTPEVEKNEALYHAVLSALAAPQLMQSKDYPGTQFLSTAMVKAGESIIGGTDYEKAFENKHREYIHVGNVEAGAAMSYQINGLEIHGVPDYLNLSKDAQGRNVFEIIDTKAPFFQQGEDWTPEIARAKAMKYRYRVQLMAYAYGMEELANKMGEPEWIDFMKKWHLDDPDKALALKDAAKAGSFRLKIAPGRYVSGLTPDVSREIEIPWDDDRRREFEDLTKNVREMVFQPKVTGKVAANVYTALATGKTIPELPDYVRTSQHVNMGYFDLFKRAAQEGGYEISMGVPRMAGGGLDWVTKKEIGSGFLSSHLQALSELGITEDYLNKIGTKVTIWKPGELYDKYISEGQSEAQAKHDVSFFGGEYNPLENELSIIGRPDNLWKEKLRRSKGISPVTVAKETIAHEFGHMAFARSYDYRQAMKRVARLDMEGAMMFESQFQLNKDELISAYGKWWPGVYATELSASYWETVARLTDPRWKKEMESGREPKEAVFAASWIRNSYVATSGTNIMGKHLPKINPFMHTPNEPSVKYLTRVVRRMMQGEWLSQFDPEELHDADPKDLAYEPAFRKIRVGEGGPEDIEITKEGVNIIPTSHLPEAKAMRGEGRGTTGTTDIRSSKFSLSRMRVGEFGPEDIMITERGIVPRVAGGQLIPGLRALGYPENMIQQMSNQQARLLIRDRTRYHAPTPQGGQILPMGNEPSGLLGQILSGETTPDIQEVQPTQPGTNIVSEEILGRLEAISGQFGTAAESFAGTAATFQGIQEAGGITMRFQGGRKPNQQKTARQLRTGITNFTNQDYINKFQEEVSRRMVDLFKETGLYEQLNIAQYEGGVNANLLINLAGEAGISTEQIMSKFTGREFQQQASRTLRGGKAIESLIGLINNTAGGFEGLKNAEGLEPVMQQALENLRPLLAPSKTDTMKIGGQEVMLNGEPMTEEDWSTMQKQKLLEATSAAEWLTGQKTVAGDIRKNPMFGVSENTQKEYNDAMRKSTKAQLDFAKEVEGSKEQQAAYKEAVKANREANTAGAKAAIEHHKALSGLYTKEGELMSTEQMAAAGITPSEEQMQEVGRVKTAERAYETAARQEGRRIPGMGEAGWQERAGGMARRLFSGFGLMYLRSIYGLATTGLETGYQERMAYEQQMAQGFLGAGGEMPITPIQEQQRILATQYGGSGAMAMQRFRNTIMSQQQPLYQFATTGLSGLSAGGMVTWAAEELFGVNDKAKALKYGAIAGLATMGINQALQIYGAASDTQGTAMNLAVRQARGENMLVTGMAPVLTGAVSGAGMGAAIGGLPGALIGGLAGGVLGGLSNYQQIAAIFNPEIGKQSELLSAIANRGTTPVSQIVQQYGYGADQTVYFARLAAEIEASKKENLGIAPEAWAAASAYELKYGASMSEQMRKNYAQYAQAGFIAESSGTQLGMAMGYSVPAGLGLIGIGGNQAIANRMNQLAGLPVPGLAGTKEAFIQSTLANPIPMTPQERLTIMGNLATQAQYGNLQTVTENLAGQGNFFAGIPTITAKPPTLATITPSQQTIDMMKAQVSQYNALPEAATVGDMAAAMSKAPFKQFTDAINNFTAAWEEAGVGPDVTKERLTAAWQAIGAFGSFGAQGARQALGPVGPNGITGEQFTRLVDYAEKLETIQASGWGTAFQQRQELWATQKALGVTPTVEQPSVEDYASRIIDPVAQAAEEFANELAAIPTDMLKNIQKQATAAFGYVPTIQYSTPMGYNQYGAQVGYGQQLGQRFMLGGLNEQVAAQLGGAFAAMPAPTFQNYSNLFSGQPLQMGAFALENTQTAAMLSMLGNVPGIGGAQLNPLNFGLTNIKIGANGMPVPTGQTWGTTSLARPWEVAQLMAQTSPMNISASIFGPSQVQVPTYTGQQAMQISAANVVNQLFNQVNPNFNPQGVNWQNNPNLNQEWISQFQQGGWNQAQAWSQVQSAQYQLAQAGIGIRQLQLQAEYQPRFWALEDRSRELGYRQTEWGFQQQWAQLGLQQENFAFQTGMQQRQMQLQRGWTQEDWRYQAQTRNLQWQWQQEDYAENLRFMTGRERRLAERQMGRATTIHDMESEQIDKQKDRQKELWAMEDERFNQSVAYQQKIFDMQEENIRMQEQFFNERKDLEAEQVALNREYWQKQHDLSMEAAQAAAGYAAQQVTIANSMMMASQNQEPLIAEGGLFNDKTWAALGIELAAVDPTFASFITNMTLVDPLLKQFDDDIKAIMTTLGGGGGGGDGGGGTKCPYCGQNYTGTYEDHVKNYHGPINHPMQHGGFVQPGERYIIGERGMEVFEPTVSGVIKPRDPWGTTYTTDYTRPASSESGRLIHLTVFVGDERLIDKVIEAVDQKVNE